MKRLILSILFVLLTVVSVNAELLMWDASASGNPTGYRVYWSTVSGEYTYNTDVGNVTQVGTSNQAGALAEYFHLNPGTWYFIVRAYNSGGESGDSNIVKHAVAGIDIEDNFPIKIIVPATTTITITKD